MTQGQAYRGCVCVCVSVCVSREGREKSEGGREREIAGREGERDRRERKAANLAPASLPQLFGNGVYWCLTGEDTSLRRLPESLIFQPCLPAPHRMPVPPIHSLPLSTLGQEEGVTGESQVAWSLCCVLCSFHSVGFRKRGERKMNPGYGGGAKSGLAVPPAESPTGRESGGHRHLL